MTATEKLSMIEKAWANGETVYVSTAMRSTKMTPKNAARFADAGRPMLKVSGANLMMVEGKHYVCADYCAITVRSE